MLIDDYKNNKSHLPFNIPKAFKQLEEAEDDPSLLAYSVILNKHRDNYQSYPPQRKICKSQNKEPVTLVKYYKTGPQEDDYKRYSTNYQNLNIDICKLELWKFVRDILRILVCDVQKFANQIFSTTI
jgi:hypothetical protein